MLKKRIAGIASLITIAAVAALSILPSSVLAAAGAIDLPPESIKNLPQVPEESISTYVPSEAAPGHGIAVNVIYPQSVRYSKDGAPVAVVVPGGEGASGLRFSMHAAQVGFIEVRFAFPGGGLKQFHSGGSWDERGKDSQKALRDVLLFAHGEKADINGKSIGQLLPVPADISNVGVVGWANGGNIMLVTMSKYPLDLGFIKWIAFYESPLGSLFVPSCLGTSSDLLINPHYRQGSAATGTPLIDFRKLTWEPGIYKNRAESTKLARKPASGLLFFDENGNRTWEESQEFAISYTCAPGGTKQYYAPEVLKAAKRLKIFGEAPPEEEETSKTKPEPAKKGGLFHKAKGGAPATAAPASAPAKAAASPSPSARAVAPAAPPAGSPRAAAGSAAARKTGAGATSSNRRSSTPAKSARAKGKKGEAPPEEERPYGWPEQMALIEESEAFFQERDGSLYIKQISLQYPDLLVTIFGSRLDHDQRQPDHPHIALNYNLWLANKPRWLRLNPDPRYIGYICDMNYLNFVNNEPNGSVDSSAIEAQLEPEGLISDQVYMQAVIAELADRARTENLKHPLPCVLVDYLNEAVKEYKKDQAAKRAQSQGAQQANQKKADK